MLTWGKSCQIKLWILFWSLMWSLSIVHGLLSSTSLKTFVFGRLKRQRRRHDNTHRYFTSFSVSQELTAAIVWWTFVTGVVVVFLCEVMNSSPGPTVSRKPCCAIAGGCTCGPAPPPRWLKVGDAFRRLRLLPPPPCCFSISHTGSNCPKKEACCPRRKVFLSVLSVIGHGRAV